MKPTRLLSVVLAVLPFWVRVRVHKIPGIAPMQRWIIERLGARGSFEHRISAGPAKGLVFRIRLPDDKLYWTGHWEAEIASTLAKLVKPGMVCLDIGGHRGFMAGILAQHGACKVHCFEPNPENIAQIEDVCALNPGLAICLHPFAIGEEDGVVEFEVMPDSAMGKLAGSEFQFDRPGVKTLKVIKRSLDSLVSEGVIKPAKIIKIDIEGGEFDALRGAERMICEQKPVLLIEIHTLALLNRCSDWLRQRGYWIDFVERHVLPIDPDHFRVCHILATPEK